MNPIITVDFDGVIHSYVSGWQGVSVIKDPPVAGAIEWLQSHLPAPEDIDPFQYEAGEFKKHGLPIVQIYSSRSKSWFGRRAMKRYLIDNGVHPGYIRDNILKFPKQKPPAFLTIDDRAICFTGSFPTREEMMRFKPWNKA